ncbi:MAG: LLM class flavin-dependent oxidoreductase [Actinobacteria bacterium]|nr:LLM class flavin-dependent oxidoreductase [Actinomycetota bacterium]
MHVAIGVSEDLPSSTQQELARDVEQAGLASLWTNEARGRDALLVCQSWASATTDLQVGVGIAPIWTRSVAQLAMAAATVQDASGGRLLLGLGVSHAPTMQAWHGVTPRAPITAARETLSALRTILAGDESDLDGEVIRTRRFRLDIEPLPSPPPLYLAAMGPQMLEVAGRSADGALLNWSTPEEVGRAVAAVRGAAAGSEGGRTPGEVEIAAYVRVAIDPDRDAARAALGRELGRYLALPNYVRHLERQGFADDVEAIRAGYRDGGSDAAVAAMPEGMLRSLGWYGTPDDPAGPMLSRYASAGLDHLIARIVPVGGDVARSVRTAVGALAQAPLAQVNAG